MTDSGKNAFPTSPPPGSNEEDRQAWVEEQRLLLMNILGAIADGVFAMRSDGRITYMNPACEVMFGISKSEVKAGNIDLLAMIYGIDGGAAGEELRKAVLEGRSIISQRMRIKTLSGKTVEISASAQGVSLNGVLARILCTCTDITTEVEQQKELDRQANTDQLTGCYNRRWFHNFLENIMRRARLQEIKVGLIFLDFDNFKLYNDLAGFLKGDALIREAAEAMRFALPRYCQLARLGGDEFIVIAEGIDYDVMMRIAANLHHSLSRIQKNLPDGGKYCVSASLGMSVLSSKNPAFTQILTLAEDAKRAAKTGGKGRICTLP